MNSCFLFRRFRFQLCLWQPVPLHCYLLHYYFQKLFHPLLPPCQMNLPQYHSPCLRNFFIFLSNRIQAFCFWLTAYRFLTPPVHQVLSARGLVTSSLYGRSTYSTSSAIFVTGIVRLFRSSCPGGVQNRISLDVAILCNKSEAPFLDTASERLFKTSLILGSSSSWLSLSSLSELPLSSFSLSSSFWTKSMFLFILITTRGRQVWND